MAVGCLSLLLMVHVIPVVFGEVVQDELFKQFVAKYKKPYIDDVVEYERRLQIFKATLKRIDYLNQKRSQGENALYGITQFADLDPLEFKQKVLKLNGSDDERSSDGYLQKEKTRRWKRSTNLLSKLADLPKRVDWREKKVINGIQNQRHCGACWAFSTIATIESMYALKYNVLPQLSVQQVIDCAKEGNIGCSGGDTCAALRWMNSTKVHLVTAAEYPLTLKTGTCKDQKSPNGVQLAKYSCADFTGLEDQMVAHLANHGPLTVAVDAVMWQDYLGGIIKYNCESLIINHAVQIVGYDLTGSIPYYIVRNSWGPEFGIKGYLYIRIGKGLCGIASEVSTVDVL